MIRAALDTSGTAIGLPEVTGAETPDDRSWFADHPDRRFRARIGNRGTWFIRRRAQGGGPDVYLRSFSRTQRLPVDDDAALAPAWYAAAYPDWPAEKAQKWGRKALKKARRP